MLHLNRWMIVHAPEAPSFEIKSKCLLENCIIVGSRVFLYEIDVDGAIVVNKWRNIVCDEENNNKQWWSRRTWFDAVISVASAIKIIRRTHRLDQHVLCDRRNHACRDKPLFCRSLMTFWKLCEREKLKSHEFLDIVTYLVACRLELASSMSGSGEGLGDFDVDGICAESCAGDVSVLLMTFVRQTLGEIAFAGEKNLLKLNEAPTFLRFFSSEHVQFPRWFFKICHKWSGKGKKNQFSWENRWKSNYSSTRILFACGSTNLHFDSDWLSDRRSTFEMETFDWPTRSSILFRRSFT